MHLPPSEKRYHEKDHEDRAIDNFAQIESPTIADLNMVAVTAQMQAGFDRFRARAAGMTYEQLINEKHRSSRLAKMLERTNDKRPSPRCDAHAIVSGGHSLAAPARAILAWCSRRIDDPINGCWLPRGLEDKPHMPDYLRNAVAHNRIHHEKYYVWLNREINPVRIKSDADLVRRLEMIKTRLQASTVPPEVAPKG